MSQSALYMCINTKFNITNFTSLFSYISFFILIFVLSFQLNLGSCILDFNIKAINHTVVISHKSNSMGIILELLKKANKQLSYVIILSLPLIVIQYTTNRRGKIRQFTLH